jgi:pimeloyl-ACP methyl ester carboxylesterase
MAQAAVNRNKLQLVIVVGGLALLALFTEGQAPATPGPTMLASDEQTLMSAHSLLVQKYADVVSRMGEAGAANLEQRIDGDVGEVAANDPAPDFSVDDWAARLHGIASLDASLTDQIASGNLLSVSGSTGLVERFFKSSVDQTLQPFALYVPADSSANPTLVVLLHGNPQTEAEILAMPYFRLLADSTGTIVAAPWARGIAGYFPPADADVYQVADVVATAFHIPANKTYLAGYSNGGFSVFKIAPQRPATWVSIMCISGAIVSSETDSVRRTFLSKRVYVVNGSSDDNIPPDYGARTAGWLTSVNIDTGFYQQPKGTHYLPTLMPVLTRAWRDMLADRIDPSAEAAARAQGPQPPPGSHEEGF